jgi:uncharacterized membrane protein
MKGVLERSWISPLIAFTFLIISVTGLMMLFHIKGHLLSHLHQWMGILFVIAGVFHLTCNWRGFLSCFKNKKQSVFAMFLVIALMLLFGLSGSFSGELAQDYGDRGGYSQSHRR